MTVYDSIADKKDMFDIKKTEGQFRLKSIKARYQELVKVNAPSNAIEVDQSENDDLDQSEHDDNSKLGKDFKSQSENDVKVNARHKREARIWARQGIRDMKGMISQILCSEGAKYSWVYIPHSYDEQFDVIALR